MRLRLAALTLAVSLGVVGLASAQESGSWYRWLLPAPVRSDAAKKLDVPGIPPSSVNNRAIKAKADLDRRQEVCMKLREIAEATGDNDLARKADMLDLRAFDLYLAAKNQSGASDRPAAAPDVKKGGR